jgi:hypothetical protein
MRRLVQNASVWALLALFGCISLFGPGWHFFVGHEFHASHGRHASCDGVSERSPAAVHDDGCPLCRFFAQAQWALEPGSAELEPTVSGSTAVVERSFWVERISSYHSRAPPSDSPIC